MLRCAPNESAHEGTQRCGPPRLVFRHKTPVAAPATSPDAIHALPRPSLFAAEASSDGGGNRWWRMFCTIDVLHLFVSQDTFVSALRGCEGEDSSMNVNEFYRKMMECFSQWRQHHWPLYILSQTEKEALGTMSRESKRMREAHTARVALARWYESVRVQRLAAQELLLASVEDKGGDPDGVGVWKFELACPGPSQRIAASLHGRAAAAEGECVELHHLRPRSQAGDGGCYVLQAPDGSDVAVVPTRHRVLLLLRVLDDLWQLNAAEAFRLPVQEWVAPGYYKKVRNAVCLASLYEDILCGAVSPVAAATTVEEYPLNYVFLRERLMVLQHNCLMFNGAGSTLASQVEVMVSAAAKSIRDAQAEEEDEAKYLTLMYERQAIAKDTYYRSLEANPEGRWHVMLPLSSEKLAAVFPPNRAATEILSSAAAAVHASLPPGRKKDLEGSRKTVAEDVTAATTTENATERDKKRVLRLGRRAYPQDGAADAVSTASNATVATATPRRRGRKPKVTNNATTTCATDFWICCDRCEEWRLLPTRIDPAPAYWECAYVGVPCDPVKVMTIAVQKEALAAGGSAGMKQRRRHSVNNATEGRKAERSRWTQEDGPQTLKRSRSCSLSVVTSSSSTSDTGSDSGDISSSTSPSDASHRSIRHGRRAPKAPKAKRLQPSSLRTMKSTAATSISFTAEWLADVEGRLRACEATPVSEDPFKMLEDLRLLEKEVASVRIK